MSLLAIKDPVAKKVIINETTCGILEADFYPDNFRLARRVANVYDAAQMPRYPVSMKLNNSQNEGAVSAAPVTSPLQARLLQQLLL